MKWGGMVFVFSLHAAHRPTPGGPADDSLRFEPPPVETVTEADGQKRFKDMLQRSTSNWQELTLM